MAPLTPAQRRARREARRLEIRRRRRRALGAVAGTVGVIAIGVFLLTSSGGEHNAGTAPDPHADWRPHTGPVPILEYHEFGAPAAGTEYPELFVSRPDFRAEMNWLDRHGYEAVTLDQVQAAWYDGAKLAPKPVVISFDDGYRPQFTFALPELKKHGWAGLLNLKAEGSDLYKSNVRAMVAAGWEIASHTITHPDLTTLDPNSLRKELRGSRAILRADFHVPVDNFCYPAGKFNDKVIAAVRAAGYRGATTEIPGFAKRSDPYRLARFEVLGSSGVDGVKEFLRGGGAGA